MRANLCLGVLLSGAGHSDTMSSGDDAETSLGRCECQIARKGGPQNGLENQLEYRGAGLP